MEVTTVGELLHWRYASLAMAHAAVSANAQEYGRVHYIIRSRLYTGPRKQTMHVGALADDERLKEDGVTPGLLLLRQQGAPGVRPSHFTEARWQKRRG